MPLGTCCLAVGQTADMWYALACSNKDAPTQLAFPTVLTPSVADRDPHNCVLSIHFRSAVH